MWVVLAVSLTGFAAQLVDGSLGMAFGVTSTSLLLILMLSPAMASSTVHLAEIGTTLASGAFHVRFGNVDRSALLKVGIPGGIGAFVGAMLLSNLDLSAARPAMALTLLALGIVILVRFSRVTLVARLRRARARWLIPLGFAGGLVDATGGGGWGPIVTSSLTASNALEPRRAIGTTNTAEVFVAIAASVGFLVGIGAQSIPWNFVLALLAGGLLAAPIAAKLVSKAPQRILGLLTGTIIVLLNVRQLAVSLNAGSSLVLMSIWVALALTAWPVVIGLRLHSSERTSGCAHSAQGDEAK
jgi:uncharacterized membrane protein YfcA